MAVQVLIGDRFGAVTAEVRPELGPVSWRLNKVGKTTLTLAKTDAKATADNLRYGNRVLVRFSEDLGLPDWGGVMALPREWSPAEVAVTCYGVEYALKFRRTAKTRAFWSAPVGGIFYHLLQEAENEEPLGLTFGRVWTGGGQHSPRYHFKSLWWVISQSLLKMEGCDVAFTPQLSDGKITFLAELFERRGEDRSDQRALKEGKNVSEARLTEQGPIVNDFVAIGSGSTWGDERPTSVAQVAESRQQFGLWQDSEVFSGVTEPTTLDRHAQTSVAATASPRTRLDLEAANAPPATFAQYGVGDTLRCILPSYMFTGYDRAVRVLTREYNPMTGKCRLVVEEETDWAPVYGGTGAENTEE